MKNHFILYAIISLLFGCSAADKQKSEKENIEIRRKEISEKSDIAGSKIINTAREEQKNKMYSTISDTTVLYWLNDDTLFLAGMSKCNIFAVNVLYKSGFYCPSENVRTYDLMDTSRFTDILPVVKFDDENDLRKGDLIIWNGHVIIYEYYTYINNDLYAVAWWAGSNQQDNGSSVINNVANGKYPLNGDFIVRRPVLK